MRIYHCGNCGIMSAKPAVDTYCKFCRVSHQELMVELVEFMEADLFSEIDPSTEWENQLVENIQEMIPEQLVDIGVGILRGQIRKDDVELRLGINQHRDAVETLMRKDEDDDGA
jgi:hypothetical protein